MTTVRRESTEVSPPTTGRPSVASQQTLDEDEPGAVLVAVPALSEGARAAVRWADSYTRTMGLRLRLIHAGTERLSADPLFPLSAAQQRLQRADFRSFLQQSLYSWAVDDCGITLSLHQVRVDGGDLLSLILREAAEPDVELVVLGSLPEDGSEQAIRVPRDLLRRCPRPMLLLGPEGASPVVVAATDCSDPALPVLQEAWRIAGALGDQVVLVHNVDQSATQFGERVGMAMTTDLADVLAERSRQWLMRTTPVRDIFITRDPSNAQGVLAAARGIGADLLVVGVKSEDSTQHGTAEQILEHVRRSILFVPLPEAASSR